MNHVTPKRLGNRSSASGDVFQANVFSLYVIKNSLGARVYIGVTRQTIEQRFRQHRNEADCDSPLLLHAAMRKYGKENFRVELLETAASEAEAHARERALIEQFGSFVPGGYNMTRGGEIGDPTLSRAWAKEIWTRPEFRKLRKRRAANRRRARARAKAKALMDPKTAGE